MSQSDIVRILKEVAETKNPLGLDVERKIFLTGGEPLLRKEELIEIAKASCKLGLSTHICTNGFMINRQFMEQIKDYPIAFSVSLDGGKKNHELLRGTGSYEKAIKCLDLMQEYRKDLFINTFTHADMFEDIDFLVETAINKNALGINFIHIIPRGRVNDAKFKRVPDKLLFRKVYELMKKSIKHYDVLLNENLFPNLASAIIAGAKNSNCGLSRDNYFFLESNGEYYPCPGMRFEEFKIGNIYENKMSEILKRKMKSAISNLCVDNFIQCSRCEFKFFCGGDCRGSAYENSNKNLYAPIPYCRQRKDSILELFRIISEDPNFFDKKANFFISNAINETEKRVKSDQT